MEIQRKTGFAPHTEALGRQIAALNEPCVGCKGCTGLCHALIDSMLLPDIFLSRRHRT